MRGAVVLMRISWHETWLHDRHLTERLRAAMLTVSPTDPQKLSRGTGKSSRIARGLGR